MITLAKVKDSAVEKGMRILKVLQFGPKTADECSPFGEDSNPLKDMTAVFAKTSEAGEPVIIGYINKNQLAKVGEKRMYSLKEDGSISSYIWMKNDGKMELAGNTDNIVRFKPLEQGLHQQDALIMAELAKIATALAAVGSVYVPGTVQTQISPAKVDEIKCI